MVAILQMTYSSLLFSKKFNGLWFTFHLNLSPNITLKFSSSFNNGSAPLRREVIIRASDDLIYRLIYASLGIDNLIWKYIMPMLKESVQAYMDYMTNVC